MSQKTPISVLLHDIRSPLARAKTLAKLLGDATAAERAQYLQMLLTALEEMDLRISTAANEES